MAETVLVAMAHPDDEVLGCGATLARHAARGDKVHLVFMADGETSRGVSYDREEWSNAIAVRHQAAEMAASVLGAEPPIFLDMPDNRLDMVPMLDLAKNLNGIVAEVQPTIVYTHLHIDLNVDHRRTREAVLVACRPLAESSVRRIYGCEVLSSTEFGDPALASPCLRRFVNVEAFLDVKLAALSCYHAETKPFPFPRSAQAIRALAAVRGSAVGLMAAEAFEILREVDF